MALKNSTTNVVHLSDVKPPIDLRRLLDEPKTKCCGYTALVEGSGEGTYYYVCRKCRKACDVE